MYGQVIYGLGHGLGGQGRAGGGVVGGQLGGLKRACVGNRAVQHTGRLWCTEWCRGVLLGPGDLGQVTGRRLGSRKRGYGLGKMDQVKGQTRCETQEWGGVMVGMDARGVCWV